jgi:hypothetical protein
MGSKEQENQEIDAKYPEGTTERDVLEYSRSKHIEDDVPPMLLAAFKVIIGITIVMAASSLFAFLVWGDSH